MIFTSWVFLLGFLPMATLGFWLTARCGRGLAATWLIVVSLTFYGLWAPYLVLLISCSILCNYGLSLAIRGSPERPRLQTTLMVIGVAADLGALLYYKYLGAIVAFLFGDAFLRTHGLDGIVLPLGISFFTFTQIGYLVDCKAGSTTDNNFRDYILFVTFFPHLIAGPLLHNTEMMPQFADRKTYRFSAANTAAGLTIFLIGMLKKSLIADQLAPVVKDAFARSESLHVVGAWGAALGYSLQLYFDFSGYSDMAIGLALLFNLRFPANFNSPYKARSIIDFWQRWHITLTRFLMQYLYNPIALTIRRRRMARGLPMSRKALEAPGLFVTMVALPTVLTMSLAGAWHGAGLQFLIFGALHGIYLTLNHGLRLYGPRARSEPRTRPVRRAVLLAQWTATFLAVLVGWVFFRASSVEGAWHMLAAMAGANGVEQPFPVPHSVPFRTTVLAPLFDRGILVAGVAPAEFKQAIMIVIGFAIVLLCPNSQQIMGEAKPVLGPLTRPAPRLLRWQPSIRWALAAAAAGEIALMSLSGTSEFLYFQF